MCPGSQGGLGSLLSSSGMPRAPSSALVPLGHYWGCPHHLLPHGTNTGVEQAMPKGGQCCVGSSHNQSPSLVFFCFVFGGLGAAKGVQGRWSKSCGGFTQLHPSGSPSGALCCFVLCRNAPRLVEGFEQDALCHPSFWGEM